jgi:ParB family chromosome partitioning protein
MAGRRVNLADLADEPPLEEARTPTFADVTPRSARVSQVAANPLNTRNVHAQPSKIAAIAESIRLNGQLQPCTVVTRTAFLGIFPEHEPAISDAAYVQVTGGRRRAAMIQLNRPTIDIVVKNDLAQSRAQFVAATAAENIDREDLDPVEEARAVQALVKECGTGKAAAAKLGRTAPWVTQRMNLLQLAPEIQEALSADDETRLPVREVRDWHGKPRQEQLARLKEWRAARGLAVASPPPPGDDAEKSATKVPSPRRSPVVAAIRRLGKTPGEIAASLRTELPADDLRALAQELLREVNH